MPTGEDREAKKVYFSMETLLGLSANVNWGYNTRNKELLFDSLVQLFNYVLPQNKGGKILLQLEGQTDTQVVGAAFSIGTIMFDNGNPSVNSVMAENAYYCLVKSIKAGNSYAAPLLLNMLDYNADAIFDKFREADLDILYQEAPNIYTLFSVSKNRHKLRFKEILPCLKFYIISLFYDILNKNLLIPKDMLRCSFTKIEDVIETVLYDMSYADALHSGRNYFERIFLKVEETLSNF